MFCNLFNLVNMLVGLQKQLCAHDMFFKHACIFTNVRTKFFQSNLVNMPVCKQKQLCAHQMFCIFFKVELLTLQPWPVWQHALYILHRKILTHDDFWIGHVETVAALNQSLNRKSVPDSQSNTDKIHSSDANRYHAVSMIQVDARAHNACRISWRPTMVISHEIILYQLHQKTNFLVVFLFTPYWMYSVEVNPKRKWQNNVNCHCASWLIHEKVLSFREKFPGFPGGTRFCSEHCNYTNSLYPEHCMFTLKKDE